MWDGPKKFAFKDAFREVNVTPEKFNALWVSKWKSAIKTEQGKKQLVELLKKGGLRRCQQGSKEARIRKRVWFINQIVGRDTRKPTVMGCSNKNKYVCMYVYTYVCMYVCIHVCICTYVCMYVCMCCLCYLCVDEWVNGWMHTT